MSVLGERLSKIDEAHARLVSAIRSDGNVVAAAVLALHEKDDRDWDRVCKACTYGEFYDEDDWPCATAEVLLGHYGIEVQR